MFVKERKGRGQFMIKMLVLKKRGILIFIQ